MDDLICYKTMPIWTAETLPGAFQRMHNTQAGTWAQLMVLKGSLIFTLMSDAGVEVERLSYTPSHQPPLIAPEQWHRIVSFSRDVECQLSFYCTQDTFGTKQSRPAGQG